MLPAQATRALLLAFLLCGCGLSQNLGEINHRFFQPRIPFDHPTFGKAQTSPIVLRIPVDPHARGDLGYVGRLVHKDLFPAHEPFVFNVVFASAPTDLCGRGNYADPSSIWYNVFFGIYEIDVPVTRHAPFGYLSPGPDAQVNKDEVMRLGLADWNYFSNHLYGVPIEAIRAISVPLDAGSVVVRGRVRLPSGDSVAEWDDVQVTEITVVGPGRSQADCEDFERRPHSELGRPGCWVRSAWQRAFGSAPRAPAAVLPRSFAPVRLQARLWMCHDEATVGGRRVYRTFFVGGTAPVGHSPRESDFLQAQMDALKRRIEREGLGFPVRQTDAAP